MNNWKTGDRARYVDPGNNAHGCMVELKDLWVGGASWNPTLWLVWPFVSDDPNDHPRPTLSFYAELHTLVTEAEWAFLQTTKGLSDVSSG